MPILHIEIENDKGIDQAIYSIQVNTSVLFIIYTDFLAYKGFISRFCLGIKPLKMLHKNPDFKLPSNSYVQKKWHQINFIKKNFTNLNYSYYNNLFLNNKIDILKKELYEIYHILYYNMPKDLLLFFLKVSNLSLQKELICLTLDKFKQNEITNLCKNDIKVPFVSIIIPIHNNLELTKSCIQSILQNSFMPYEIILIDNNSKIETATYLENISNKYDHIKLIINNKNLSFSHANNKAIPYTKGDFILFLNNDTKVTPHWIWELYRVYLYKKNVGAVGAKLLYPDNTIQHAGVEFTESNGVEHLFKNFSRELPYANQIQEYTAVTAACLLINKKLFIDVGGFDTNYINCFEDVDLCLKIRHFGKQIFCSPFPDIYHFESKTKGRKDNEQSSGIYFIKKWHLSNLIIKYLDKEKYKSAGFLLTVVNNERKLEPLPNLETILDKFDKDFKNQLYLETYKEILPLLWMNSSLNDTLQYYVDFIINANNNKILLSPEQKDISIIIPVHNNLLYTKNCLQSIYKHTNKNINFEIIIINNNSFDETTNFLKQASNKYKNIKVINNNQNKSFSASNNQAVLTSNSHYIFFLNNDTKVTDYWLKNALKTLKSDNKIGIVGAKLLYENNTIQHAGVVKSKLYNIPTHFMQYAHQNHPAVTKIKEMQFVTAACMAIKKDIFNKIGGFDENFINAYEDIDLCLKVKKYGYKIIYDPNIIVYHFESKTRGRKLQKNLEVSAKLLKKNWPNINNDADFWYQKYNLILKANHKTHEFILDFKDISIYNRLQEAYIAYTKKDFPMVISLLEPVFLLRPYNNHKSVYQLLYNAYLAVNNNYKLIDVENFIKK